MALMVVGDVVQSTATLLDDPSQSEIDADYVVPFMNLRWQNLVVNMAMLGLQYTEEEAVITLQPFTVSLASLQLSGQPLASMMEPIGLDWKYVGAADEEYQPADQVQELDDLSAGSQGILQYSWQGGTVLVTPSQVACVIRLRFNAMSTTLVDPTDGMVRNVGDILAYRVAEMIYAIRGNPAMQKNCKDWGDTALDDFFAMAVMRGQTILTKVLSTHRRNWNGSGTFIARS